MKLEKSTSEVYKIRVNETWANITIENLGNKGYISIQSDFGSWNNYWGSCGCDFKEFLTELDMHYFSKKITPRENNYIFKQETIDKFKNDFESAFDNGDIDEEIYNYLVGDIKKLESYGRIEDGLRSCERILDFYHYQPELETGISPSFQNFWKKLWVPFVNQVLKKEINNGKEST